VKEREKRREKRMIQNAKGPDGGSRTSGARYKASCTETGTKATGRLEGTTCRDDQVQMLLWMLGRRMGVGIIFRTHEGEVMVTKCSTKPYITDPQTAEAVAAWTAANLVWQLELKDVILEGDSLPVVQVLRS
jgi:hypothetical protein